MKEETLLQALNKNPFLLAPMAGVTDSPFRSFMKDMGAGIMTTELVSAKSLELNNEKSKKLMHFTEKQKPIGIQIFGENLSSLDYSAKVCEQAGADFIDLNCGCPVTKIVKKGAGSALLKDLKFLKKVLNTLKKAVSIPVSLKIRTGWDEHSRNAFETARIAHEEGIIWLSIHGRTRAQGYSGTADWDYIAEVKKQSLLPVIGNGDLTTAKKAWDLKNKTHCDGMMIGRGCLKNPWIFQEIQRAVQDPAAGSAQSAPAMQKNYSKILKKLTFYLENFYDERMFLLQYKKFCAWYSSGFPNSSEFRQKIFQTRERSALLDLIENYFYRMDVLLKKDTAYEPSLMQGHG